MTGKILVLSACGSQEEAVRIANHLVEQKFAACVNVSSPVRSIYRWEGKIESAMEWLLVIKTSEAKFADVSSAIAALHSYELPEIIALPVVQGSPAYLQWIEDGTSP